MKSIIFVVEKMLSSTRQRNQLKTNQVTKITQTLIFVGIHQIQPITKITKTIIFVKLQNISKNDTFCLPFCAKVTFDDCLLNEPFLKSLIFSRFFHNS